MNNKQFILLTNNEYSRTNDKHNGNYSSIMEECHMIMLSSKAGIIRSIKVSKSRLRAKFSIVVNSIVAIKPSSQLFVERLD